MPTEEKIMTDGHSIEDRVAELGEIVFSTKGRSMYPMLRNRKDMSVIRRYEGEKLNVGDVPVFRRKHGKLVMHRIVKITPEMYITRGDNEIHYEKVRPERIFGVLKGFYRNGRYIDCEKSRLYKCYVFLNRISYPIRFLRKKLLRFLRRRKKNR